MGLSDLYEKMEKNASDNNLDENDEWTEAAASYGMTKEAFMDKLAEQQVEEEVEMVKQSNEAKYLGKCMGYGYMDAMNKIANANSARDGIPESYIKVARASLHGICSGMIKAANSPERAAAVFQELSK